MVQAPIPQSSQATKAMYQIQYHVTKNTKVPLLAMRLCGESVDSCNFCPADYFPTLFFLLGG